MNFRLDDSCCHFVVGRTRRKMQGRKVGREVENYSKVASPIRGWRLVVQEERRRNARLR
jgi:hypothetical protein